MHQSLIKNEKVSSSQNKKHANAKYICLGHDKLYKYT